MEHDALLALEQEARKLERALDRAVVRRDHAEVDHIHKRLLAITREQKSTYPTTAPGAAVALDDACFTLSEHTSFPYYAMKRLRAIMRRFKRNERRLEDQIELYELLDWARCEYEGHDPDSDLARVPKSIEKALSGIRAVSCH